MSFLREFIDWVEKLLNAADKELAKTSVLIVTEIQPLLFSGAFTDLAVVFDAVTRTQIPEEILTDLRKWLPIFLTTETIVTSINPNTTEQDIQNDLVKLQAEFPKWDWLQRSKYWNGLASKIYIMVKNVGEGKKVSWATVSAIIEQAFQQLLDQKLLPQNNKA